MESLSKSCYMWKLKDHVDVCVCLFSCHDVFIFNPNWNTTVLFIFILLIVLQYKSSACQQDYELWLAHFNKFTCSHATHNISHAENWLNLPHSDLGMVEAKADCSAQSIRTANRSSTSQSENISWWRMKKQRSNHVSHKCSECVHMSETSCKWKTMVRSSIHHLIYLRSCFF